MYRNEYETELQAKELCLGIVFFGVCSLLLTCRLNWMASSPPMASVAIHMAPKCVSSHLDAQQAPHIQCVHNWTCLLLKHVLQCMVPPCVLLKTNMSFPLPPSFLTSNPFFLPPLKCPLSLSICTILCRDISCLDYPLVISLASLPLTKPSSQT